MPCNEYWASAYDAAMQNTKTNHLIFFMMKFLETGKLYGEKASSSLPTSVLAESGSMGIISAYSQ
jgi:hypothetical protein